MQKTTNTTHWVLGGALLLIGLFVIIALILVRSQADTSYPEASVDVDNEGPTISSIKICAGTATAGNAGSCSDLSSGITLSAGATDSNTVVVVLNDNNGTSDMPANNTSSKDGNNYFGVFGDPGCAASPADNNDCYGLTCSYLDEITTTSAYYTCPISLAYYADQSSSWRVKAEFQDTAGSSVATYDTYTVNSLIAASFANIPFGTQSLGYETPIGEEIAVSHFNNGNVIVDFDLVAESDLGCSTLGTIPAANIKFDGSSNQGYSTSTYSLSSSATVDNWADLNAPVRTNDTSTSAHEDTSYWSIKVPSSGIAGTCVATITAIAVSDQ